LCDSHISVRCSSQEDMNTYRLLQLARIHGSKKLNIPKNIQEWEKLLPSRIDVARDVSIQNGLLRNTIQDGLLHNSIQDGSLSNAIQDELCNNSIQDGSLSNAIQDELCNNSHILDFQTNTDISVESYPSTQIELELEQLFGLDQRESNESQKVLFIYLTIGLPSFSDESESKEEEGMGICY